MTPIQATLSALLSLPIHHEDVADERKPAQYAALAHEIAKLKPPPGVGAKEWRALVIAIGWAESNYSLRIMAGNCKPFECDRGRARSNWQMQSNKFTAPVWDQLQGFETLHVQVQTADKMLKVAYRTCVRTPSVAWVDPVIRFYAGRGCDDTKTIEPWRGVVVRRNYWLKAWKAMG